MRNEVLLSKPEPRSNFVWGFDCKSFESISEKIFLRPAFPFVNFLSFDAYFT